MNRLLGRATLTLALALAPLALRADDPPPAGLSFGEGRPIGTLEDRAVRESSGIAASTTIEGAFWTHNDSGSAPELFLFDRAGKSLGTFPVEGAKARDWEDIASFSLEGKHWLLVADTGDNASKRDHVVLYLVEEPRERPAPGARGTLRVARALRVRWAGGPIDCEGAGVSVATKQILLVTKVRHGSEAPSVHSVPLDALLGSTPETEPVETKKLASLPSVPKLTTGLDVSADGRRLVVCTYKDAYGWARGERETWAAALVRAPVRIALPKRAQGEAICFGADGKSLFLTSEGSPCPLFEVPPR